MATKSHKTAVVIIPPEECCQDIQSVRSKFDKAYKRWMPHINLVYPFMNEHDLQLDREWSRMTTLLGEVEPFHVCLGASGLRTFNHGRRVTMWLQPSVSKGCSGQARNPVMPTRNSEHVTSFDSQIPPASGLDSLSSANWGVEESSPSREERDRSTTLPLTGLDALRDAEWKTGGHERNAGVPEIQSRPVPASDTSTPGSVHPSVLRICSLLRTLYPEYNDLDLKSDTGFQPHLTLGQCSTKMESLDEITNTLQDVRFKVDNIYVISRQGQDDPFKVISTIPLGIKQTTDE